MSDGQESGVAGRDEDGPRSGDATVPIEPPARKAGTTVAIRVVGPDSPGSSSPLDEFRIVRAIGQGGMGRVYKAIQRSTGRSVALKTIRPEFAADPVYRERFIREATAAGELRHPGIVWLHAAGEAEGTLWIAYEWVEGKDLGGILDKEGRLRPRRAVLLAAEIAEALHAAHLRGIIHRDLKPDNVIIDESGAARLADFGLAKKLPTFIEGGPELPALSMPGEAMGTPHYMAPEQATGKIDLHGPWTDLWALGVLLYRSLTGVVPFDASGLFPLLSAIARKGYRPAGEFVPELPPVLDSILAQLLEKDPRRRAFQADVLARVLQRIAGELAEPLGHDEKLEVPPSRQRSLSASSLSFTSLRDWRPSKLPARLPRRDDTVGRYRVVELFGSSPLGALLLAEEPTFKLVVAIRFPVLDPASDRDAIGRLKARIEPVLGLRHPGILPFDEAGLWNGVPYLVARWLEAPTLREVLAESGSLPREYALPLLRRLADVLDFAHDSGAFHGSLRPSVVFLEGDGPVLRDFGLVGHWEAGLAPDRRIVLQKDLAAFGDLIVECFAPGGGSKDRRVIEPEVLDLVRKCKSQGGSYRGFHELKADLDSLSLGRAPGAARHPGRAVLRFLRGLPPRRTAVVSVALILAVAAWVLASRGWPGTSPDRPSAAARPLRLLWRLGPDDPAARRMRTVLGIADAAERLPLSRHSFSADFDGDGADDALVLEDHDRMRSGNGASVRAVLIDGRSNRPAGWVDLDSIPATYPIIVDQDGDGFPEAVFLLADGSLMALGSRP